MNSRSNIKIIREISEILDLKRKKIINSRSIYHSTSLSLWVIKKDITQVIMV